jgi:uncharacterized protein (TIGR00288 family)
MPSPAVLFIDGSNFYHSLKEQRCLPFGAAEFQKLFTQLSKKYELKKVYFYDSLKNSQKDPEGYSKQQSFHERLKKSHNMLVIRKRKLRYLVNITENQIQKAAEEAGIVDSCRKKLMQFLINLNLIRLTKEKGVDVQLVVDAIEEARSHTLDTVILLSGDADFVPAIQLIKSYGVKTINLHTYYGSSAELRNTCDQHVLIDFSTGEPTLR